MDKNSLRKINLKALFEFKHTKDYNRINMHHYELYNFLTLSVNTPA